MMGPRSLVRRVAAWLSTLAILAAQAAQADPETLERMLAEVGDMSPEELERLLSEETDTLAMAGDDE